MGWRPAHRRSERGVFGLPTVVAPRRNFGQASGGINWPAGTSRLVGRGLFATAMVTAALPTIQEFDRPAFVAGALRR
jgi:hypothetical protein